MNKLFSFFLFFWLFGTGFSHCTSTFLAAIDENGEKETSPCTIVIFGATGDLAARKLLPALYHLSRDGHISAQTTIVGFARSNLSDEIFRMQMRRAVESSLKDHLVDPVFWPSFEKKIFYLSSDFDHDAGYQNLEHSLSQIDQEYGTQGNRIYYLATPPSQFLPIIRKLAEHQLIQHPESESWSKVIIEKPFGKDLDSAMILHNEISRYLDETQIFLMDHYLGKEGVQNLLSLRFENALFEGIWNNRYIDNIQITLCEELGIGSRAQFWEETGSLRDVFQNHLMQLLAIVAMEPPSALTYLEVNQKKIELLNAIRPFPRNEADRYVIRAQYDQGKINGVAVPSYENEIGVRENSSAETYVAAKLFIDNPRWKGVPFYIRCGKRLQKQTTEIVVTFKNRNPTSDQKDSNSLYIRIQPNPALFVKLLTKVPQMNKEIQPILFGFQPELVFKKSSPEAYEKLFYDCIRGDHTRFAQPQEQLASWRLLTPILHHWKTQPEKMSRYEAGSWGPMDADRLLENGHQWKLLEN